MPSTFEAFWVVVFALLPGALYTWVFEHEAAAWGVKASDRIYRFIGISVVFHAVAAPLTYYLYLHFLRTGQLLRGTAKDYCLWPIILLYVAIPVAAGWWIGNAAHERKTWVRYVVGRAPAPRAWDHLFATADLEGWVRIRLKSGGWICGAYARARSTGLHSYAAGYPEDQDILLAQTVRCNQETGLPEFGPDSRPLLEDVATLVRWDEVSYLEFASTPRGGS